MNFMSEQLFDVVVVSLDTNKVRIIASGKTKDNAGAIVSMAVMRRGLDEEFFSECPHGSFADGEEFKKL
jgi:hypothetical protein